MNQGFEAAVIQQPETPKKLKKNFCFATIPFVFIALLCLYSCIHRIVMITENPSIGNFLYLSGDFFDFSAAVLLTVLLLAKVYKKISAIPLFMFSAGYLMRFAAQFAWAFTDGYLLNRLHWLLMLLSASLGFLFVAVYSFIVISKKRPAPKVLWIIPAILFNLLFAPWAICMFIELIDIIFNFYKPNIPWIPTYFIDFLFPVAIILFLIWISFPYKKDKSKKPVQPAPAVEPVIAPVMPEVEPTAENCTEIDESVMQLLKEYKELLDGGVITQEYYEKKKNELLGL